MCICVYPDTFLQRSLMQFYLGISMHAIQNTFRQLLFTKFCFYILDVEFHYLKYMHILIKASLFSVLEKTCQSLF